MRKIGKLLSMIVSFAMVATVFMVAVPVNVSPEELLESWNGNGWWVNGNGTFFEITNSKYLNITMTSSEIIFIHMESIPKVVSFHIEADCTALSTDIALSGFEVGKSYYRYQDGYLQEEFTSDETGSYSYIQDISIPHHIFIQEEDSTLYIRDDATGGDGYLIGNWDWPTKTLTLTTDVFETIIIEDNEITLNGNGHSISKGVGSYGIYAYPGTGISIFDVTISGFTYGILLLGDSNTINGNTVSESSLGIYLQGIPSSWGNTINENTVSTNDGTGIVIRFSSENTISDNMVSSNGWWTGIYIDSSSSNTISGNSVSGEYNGIELYLSSSDTVIGNTISGNIVGIRLSVPSGSETISRNTISGNTYGIRLDIAHSNTISENVISDNTQSGIYLYGSRYNTINDNKISGNGYHGIYLRNYNTMTTINNEIYNNIFANNPVQAYGPSGFENFFNLAAPIGGNYWDDYDEPNEGAVDNNGDGFADSPYFFTGGRDNLPWILPPIPIFQFTPSSIDFGDVGIGYPTSYFVTLSNIGGKDLTINDLSFVSGSEFSITSAPTTPFIISSATSERIKITLEASTTGSFTDTLQITSDDPDNNLAEVTLSGLASTTAMQEIMWYDQFGTMEYDDSWRGIAIDSTGVYMAGYTGGILPGETSLGLWDAFVRKNDFDGNELWTAQFGTSDSDEVYGITIDSTGLYVAGYTHESGDVYVSKRSLSDGSEIWMEQFGTSSVDWASSIAIDSTGVYVAGTTKGTFPGESSAGGMDTFVSKRSLIDGSEIWIEQFGTNGGDDCWGGISIDSTGLYVAGDTSGTFPEETNEGGTDIFVSKRSLSDGSEIWIDQFGSLGFDSPHGIFVDSSGVYVAGQTYGTLPGKSSAGSCDAFIRKYDSSGNEQWTKQFGTSGRDWAYGVFVQSNNIYLAGATEGAFQGQINAGGWDAFVRIYDLDGNEAWTHQFGTPQMDEAVGIVADSSGVYVSCTTRGALPGQTHEGSSDAFFAKLGTHTGPNVEVNPDPDVNMTFQNVLESGITTVTKTTTNPGDELANFKFVGTYYNITTTATIDGIITVYLSYNESHVKGQEANIKIFHWENGQWVKLENTEVNEDKNIAWATVTSLSPFVIGYEVIPVDIDLKPGSDPNSINLGSEGNVPVAILTTADFDATNVNPETVTLAGASVGLKGKSDKLMASIKDVDGDGDDDIMIHIDIEELDLVPGSTAAALFGFTYDDIEIKGIDSVNIVPP